MGLAKIAEISSAYIGRICVLLHVMVRKYIFCFIGASLSTRLRGSDTKLGSANTAAGWRHQLLTWIPITCCWNILRSFPRGNEHGLTNSPLLARLYINGSWVRTEYWFKPTETAKSSLDLQATGCKKSNNSADVLLIQSCKPEAMDLLMKVNIVMHPGISARTGLAASCWHEIIDYAIRFPTRNHSQPNHSQPLFINPHFRPSGMHYDELYPTTVRRWQVSTSSINILVIKLQALQALYRSYHLSSTI